MEILVYHHITHMHLFLVNMVEEHHIMEETTVQLFGWEEVLQVLTVPAAILLNSITRDMIRE